jgi:hypothetical protein
VAQGITHDWAWFAAAHDRFLELSESDRAALRERIAFISQSPWPDWSSKEFVNDLPSETLLALAEAGESYHFILYADDGWAIVYEVVQPWVFVIYSFTRL